MRKTILRIIGIALFGILMAGCATGNVGQTGADQGGAQPKSANETPGPGKGPSGRF